MTEQQKDIKTEKDRGIDRERQKDWRADEQRDRETER
jgi:hypothetical protein